VPVDSVTYHTGGEEEPGRSEKLKLDLPPNIRIQPIGEKDTLAAMLRDGIPLEGGLKELCAGMRAGPLRAEIEQLEAALSQGTPLQEALAGRRLPPFYIQMIEIGVRSNDLPGVLTMVADHYHRTNALWARLKGLMVYPLIVIVVSLGLTLTLSLVFSRFLPDLFNQIGPQPFPLPVMICLWVPPVMLAAAALFCVVALANPAWRQRLKWRLPAFREASLSQLAAALSLMLKNGSTLPEALALAEVIEAGSPAARTLAQWRSLVESGHGKPVQWTVPAHPFPPLFLWLVNKGGEDVAAGFQKAADLFHDRASYRIEMALYGALPISILLLGQMVFWQVAPLFRAMTWLMNLLGAFGG